jgi:hypothetical protein
MPDIDEAGTTKVTVGAGIPTPPPDQAPPRVISVPVTVVCSTCGYLLAEELATAPSHKIRVPMCPACSRRLKAFQY